MIRAVTDREFDQVMSGPQKKDEILKQIALPS